MDYIKQLHRKWLKLTTPLLGSIPAKGYWVSGKEYYQHYQGQLPGLEYHTCYPEHDVTYQLPRSIHSPIHAYFLQKTERKIPEAYWLTVPNGIILRAHRSMGSVVAHDGKVIHDSSRQYWYKVEENEALYRKFPAQQVIDKCIAVTTDGGGGLNYWHWLFDILPRIYLLKHGDIWTKIDYFLVDKPLDKMRLTLEIMGIEKGQVIYTEYNSSLRTNSVIVPQFISEKSRWIVDFLRSYFLPHKLEKQIKVEKVYISRAKAKRRRIINEDQVLDYLLPLGYKPVYLEDLSFAEQISLFNNARYVIGLHGAGMTNIIWCESGSRVLEIFPSEPWRDCYWALANHAGLDYYYWCPVSPDENEILSNGFNNDILIDVHKFARVLEHFES
jgi:capsular polysaccharide biosynthesis protein